MGKGVVRWLSAVVSSATVVAAVSRVGLTLAAGDGAGAG